jgi:hypothetical protein
MEGLKSSGSRPDDRRARRAPRVKPPYTDAARGVEGTRARDDRQSRCRTKRDPASMGAPPQESGNRGSSQATLERPTVLEPSVRQTMAVVPDERCMDLRRRRTRSSALHAHLRQRRSPRTISSPAMRGTARAAGGMHEAGSAEIQLQPRSGPASLKALEARRLGATERCVASQDLERSLSRARRSGTSSPGRGSSRSGSPRHKPARHEAAWG